MSDKPEALRLADQLQQQAVWEGHYGPSYLRDLLPEAAAELRRLHAECEALRADAGRADKLRSLLKEARQIIRASASRNLAKDWDRRATDAMAKEQANANT